MFNLVLKKKRPDSFCRKRWTAEAKSFYVTRLQRANLKPEECKLREGRWALLRGRNFQALTLVKHEAGGLLRQRAGWLVRTRERAKACQLPETSPGGEKWTRCPFPTPRRCDFRRRAPEGPRTQSKLPALCETTHFQYVYYVTSLRQSPGMIIIITIYLTEKGRLFINQNDSLLATSVKAPWMK